MEKRQGTAAQLARVTVINTAEASSDTGHWHYSLINSSFRETRGVKAVTPADGEFTCQLTLFNNLAQKKKKIYQTHMNVRGWAQIYRHKPTQIHI